MRKIAVVKVTWFNTHCDEGYIIGAHPILSERENWTEVSEEEYSEICSFVRDTKNNSCYQPGYVILEKENGDFETDFAAWKEKTKKAEEKMEKERQVRAKAEATRAKRRKEKQIEKARRLLEAAGELE